MAVLSHRGDVHRPTDSLMSFWVSDVAMVVLSDLDRELKSCSWEEERPRGFSADVIGPRTIVDEVICEMGNGV